MRDGRWIQTRILPYLTDRGLVAGVVVTFVDVTVTKEAQERLQAVINSLPEHIAVLDRNGAITMTNAAWDRFARQNGAPEPERCGIGSNYLEVCACEPEEDEGGIRRSVRDGLAAILAGRAEQFVIEYPCHSTDEQRWFLMYAARLDSPVGGVVVSHINITRRKMMELRLADGMEAAQ